MNKRTLYKLAVLVTVVSGGIMHPMRSMAFITYYSDEAAWRVAVNLTVMEPFNAGGLQPFTSVSTVAGGIGPASGVLSGSVWKDSMYNNPVYQSRTTFSYAPGQIVGAGALWDTSVNGDGIGIDIYMDGGSESVGHIGAIHGTFFGWTSSTPFNSFLMNIYFLQGGGGETFDMDNLEFALVPEPGMREILGMGVIGIGILRRKC